MKYVGVIIDHKLKWCEHISYVSKGLALALFSNKNGFRPKMFTYPL